MKATLAAITQPRIPGLMTPDEFIAYAARVSNPSNQMNTETAPRLIKYLATKRHWSPFEMASMTIELVTTRDIGRQILRHRSFSFQEFSQRYAEVVEAPVLSEARLQDTKNRQNSIEVDDAELQVWWDREQDYIALAAASVYKAALAKGIAKEVARKVLPEGLTPTTMYMAGTIRSWIHYTLERTDAGVQKEHRLLAEQIKPILLAEFPSLELLFTKDPA